jgi:hypothetical protein
VIPAELVKYVVRNEGCGETADKGCLLYFLPGDREVVVLADMCFRAKADPRHSIYCHGPAILYLIDGKWTEQGKNPPPGPTEAARAGEAQAYAQGKVEVRAVTRRQVFIDGKPVLEPFE